MSDTNRRSLAGCLAVAVSPILAAVILCPLSGQILELWQPWVGRAFEGTVVPKLPEDGQLGLGRVVLTKEGERIRIPSGNGMSWAAQVGCDVRHGAHEPTVEVLSYPPENWDPIPGSFREYPWVARALEGTIVESIPTEEPSSFHVYGPVIVLTRDGERVVIWEDAGMTIPPLVGSVVRKAANARSFVLNRPPLSAPVLWYPLSHSLLFPCLWVCLSAVLAIVFGVCVARVVGKSGKPKPE